MVSDISAFRPLLKSGDFGKLFNELGWDRLKTGLTVLVGGTLYALTPIAEKRGVQIFQCAPDGSGKIPEYAVRRKIEAEVTKSAFHHVIVFTDAKKTTQIWQWVAREAGKALAYREQAYHVGQSGDALLQKLDRIAFPLSEEEGLTLSGVTFRLKDAFDKDKVTKKFYDRFQKEHDAFLGFIKNIPDADFQRWYASVMINRLMFLYFIQAKGFLDSDTAYLKNKLKQNHGHFYRDFLCPLFFDGFAQRHHSPETTKKLGKVPYLNGGLFAKHQIEEQYGTAIAIPDEAFEKLFAFFDGYNWYLDDRPLGHDNEINPDVLGYIFEKYINQKQMGAYYTKEDITEYIGKNTILPFLLDRAREDCQVAFAGEDGLWRLLRDDPDRYIYPAVRHGTEHALPDFIARGVTEVSKRDEWNKPAPSAFGLPTEIWREVVARRQRYEVVKTTLAAGKVREVGDLITYNLDIRQFAQDCIEQGGPEFLLAVWNVLNGTKEGRLPMSVLDPTCGSGAFLFAALEILDPLYEACLDRMASFVADADLLGHFKEHPRFRDILKGAADHSDRRYFVLKNIIVNNLFGVDIMEEATEICKLRLFLKLAAQVEADPKKDNFGIEPLPDIDFNIRAGNTLVGFATEAQTEKAVTGRLDFEDAWPRIQSQAAVAAKLFEEFQKSQNDMSTTSEYSALMKSGLRERLRPLRDELDKYLGQRYGKIGKESLASWKKSAQPFHWFIEFYNVMKAGGFDVLIGNPPYVAVKNLDYPLAEAKGSKFSDIYAHVLIRSLALGTQSSRIGMIIPLSLTFSEDFGELRETLVKSGSNWLSSYDNIPASLFAGVSQRCTIWIGSRTMETCLYVAPMYRWRAEYRPQLTQNIAYTKADGSDAATEGFPKLAMAEGFEVLARLVKASCSSARGMVLGSKHNKEQIRFSQAARNFVSAFIESPPCVDADSLALVPSSKIGTLSVPNKDTATASLVILSGEIYFWYWLSRGDGFDVTGWIVSDFITTLNSLSDSHITLLSALGDLLHDRRLEALVFKKNAGKYVGNYNYRGMFSITRRADLIFMAGIGANRDQVFSIFDYVQRVLAINVSAGEKSIPSTLKERYSPTAVNKAKQENLFAESDAFITQHYGLSAEETDYIINHDIKYRKGRGGDEAEAE